MLIHRVASALAAPPSHLPVWTARITIISTLFIFCMMAATTIYVSYTRVKPTFYFLRRRFVKLLKFFRGDQHSRNHITHGPQPITIYCTTDQFNKNNIRANDLAITYASLPPPAITSISHISIETPLYMEDLFVQICQFSSLRDVPTLAILSKQHYLMYKEHFYEIYTHMHFKNHFNLSISEQLFKTTRVFDQYRLYLDFHSSDKTRFCPGHLFWLIAGIGPFTFLSIPYVDNFSLSPPKFPVERSSCEWPKGHKLPELRFQLKIDHKTSITQRISYYSGLRCWCAQGQGIWYNSVVLLPEDFEFLISLLQNPEGVSYESVAPRINVEVFPHPPGVGPVTFHVKLEPPLTALLNDTNT